MIMKKLFFTIALLIATLSFAQHGDKIKAYKAAFITEALDLTAAEAQQFWPIYNEHEDKLMDLRKKERKEIFETINGNVDNLSETEANALLDKVMNIRAKELQYHMELVQKLKGVLPAKKILKLHRAEEEFKKVLLQKVKGKRGRP